MNERIRELFKQTALHRNDHTTEQRLYEVEKFAELIVEECAHIAWLYDEPKLSGSGSHIADSIKEHFGVTE